MIYFSTGDPYFGKITIFARGNLSIEEINKLTSDVEFIVNEKKELKIIFYKLDALAIWGQEVVETLMT